MITNMQIVNHVREDGWQIHAIFNLDKWGDLPCQLVSHVDGGGYRVKGMWRPDDHGTCGFTDLNERFVDRAADAYGVAMTAIFGAEWYKVTDGRTRVMEWTNHPSVVEEDA
jgi:hypothetical protein